MSRETFIPDEACMRKAISLALKGSGHVNPNPLVGAVIVRDGEILGQGYHACYGQAHAERNAIADAAARGADLSGSTIYVTLEPCCHHGKQPPCTDALIEAGISRVVVGSDDPNPLVSGKGFEILRSHGIEVIPHFLKEECDRINDVFFHYIRTGSPFVAMKYAMTMDGKICCRTGDSKWVTGEAARGHVQQLRNHYKGIMVGIGTVLADDPTLSCRMEGGRDPVRIVADSHLRIPLESNLVRTAEKQPLIVACLPEPFGGRQDEAEDRIRLLEEKGVKVLRIPAEEGKESIDLRLLTEALGREKVDGILLEGGGTLNESALRAGLVNKVYCYIAPKIFGGRDAKTPVEGLGAALARDAWMFRRTAVSSFGDDLLIEYSRKGEVCLQES